MSQLLDGNVTPNALSVACCLDVALITDLSGDAEEVKPEVVYGLGSKGDPEAGLPGYMITPWFKNIAELEQFCGEHAAKYLEIAEDDALPDRWFWE